MLPWNRPSPHATFAADAATRLAALRDAVAKNRGVPRSDHFGAAEIWTASWQRGSHPRGVHKRALVGNDPWLSKCAWCEQRRSPARELDVEHYRPKVKVTGWAGVPSLVSDTPPAEVNEQAGYWWLAFDWSNYSLACKTCNQGWKRMLFPVVPEPLAFVEGVERFEQPLLIDPAGSFRTRDHFRWGIGAIMEPVSERGRATIITCGLNRRDLTTRRVKVAHDVSERLDTFTGALRRRDLSVQRSSFPKLCELGARSEEFTSMVRWLVEERLGCSWEQLEGAPE